MKKIYILFLASTFALAIQAQIVINEINYNPPESGVDTTEFLELFNTGSLAVDVSNWTFSSGVAFTFPNSTIISAGDFFVIAVNASAFNNRFGFMPDGNFTGGLSNSGENIVLADNLGVTIDSLRYDDVAPWPTAPNGDGSSLELINPTLDNTDGNNWQASLDSINFPLVNGNTVRSTPGAINSGICPPLMSNVTETICFGDSLVVGSEVFRTDTMATVIIPNAGPMGMCDSTVTLDLTVLFPLTSRFDTTIQSGGSVTINGMVIDSTVSGLDIVFTGVGSSMCDSTVTVNVTEINNSITTAEDTARAVIQGGAAYQWINCDSNNIEIVGEINESFTATQSGSYAVVIELNGVADTSECVAIIVTDVNEVANVDANIIIYPNPTTSRFAITSNQIEKNTTVTVYNLLGKEIITRKVTQKNTVLDLKNNENGVYFVRVENDTETITKRVIKQ